MSNTFSAADYYSLLEGGPQTIKSLLEHFGLPSTSSGRQKFRDANSAFNKQFDGQARIVGAWIQQGEGEEATSQKAFKIELLVPNTNEATGG